MEGKAITHSRLRSHLKACLLAGCCISMLVGGISAHAQEESAMPDLEAVLPSPQKMQDDGEANGLTLLPEDEATSETMPAVVPTPIPEVGENAIADTQNPVPEQQPVESQADDEAWRGSLMFDDEKVKNLLAIYRAYLLRQQQEGPRVDDEAATSGIDVGDIIGGLPGGEKPKEIAEEVLKFSLHSIVYDSPTQWSMWVNGQRFSRKQAEEGFTIDNSQLRVLQANNREVTYLWMPIAESYNLVRQRWEDKQNRGNIFTDTQVAQNERVEFDEDGRTITVTLRPNQTFVSQYMSVMEGVDKPRAAQTAAVDEMAANKAEQEEGGHNHPEEEEGALPVHEREENSAPVKAKSPPKPENGKAEVEAKKAPARNTRNYNSNPLGEESAPPPDEPKSGTKPEESGETSLPFSKGNVPAATETPAPKVLSGSH